MLNRKNTLIIFFLIFTFFLAINLSPVLAARTDSFWKSVGTRIQTISPTGYDILINGINKYLNFNALQGSTGYGFRDNSGTMEVKNSGGSWAGIGTGSSDVDALTDLSDVTLTGTSTGDIIFLDEVGPTWANLSIGLQGQVLKVDAGLPAWGTDNNSGGGGGSWTNIAGAIYNSTTTDQVLIGRTATTTTNKLEVHGSISGDYFVATSTTATSTFAGGINFDDDEFVFDPVTNTLSLGTTETGLTINGVTKSSKLFTESQGGGNAFDIIFERHSNTASAVLTGARSRGSHDSPIVVVDGDNIFEIKGTAYDGTDWENLAEIHFEVDGTPGDNDMPGKLRFLTTPDGSVTALERMTIKNNGNVGIGTTTPLQTLSVEGNTYVLGNSTTTGTIYTGSKNLTSYANYFNGSFLESFNATTTSNGSVVTMTLADSASYTGGLTMRFSTGDVVLPTATSTTLTAGTDASPQENFVYIPISTKTVTVSTTGFPASEEHIKIAYFFVPSAGFVQTNGVYVNQNWNDHAQDNNNQGHETHVGERIRRDGAVYFSGIDGNGTDGYISPTAGNTELISTSGVIYQMHKHAFPAFDTSGGDIVLVKNWSGDTFHDITNLYDIIDDSTGTTIGDNKYFNLVIWGVANKTGQMEQMMINLPSGSYNTQSGAENDTSGFDDFTIPREFRNESSNGFLIARLTIQMKTGGGTWVAISEVDLRGSTPQSATGGTAAGSLVNFPDNTFTIFDNIDSTKIGAFDIGTNVTTGNTRTIQWPDNDGTMCTLEGNQTFTGLINFSNVGTTTIVNLWMGNLQAGNYIETPYINSTSTATSTFTGGIQVNVLDVQSTTATSTFGNGINLANGCFSINGTCLVDTNTGDVFSWTPTITYGENTSATSTPIFLKDTLYASSTVIFAETANGGKLEWGSNILDIRNSSDDTSFTITNKATGLESVVMGTFGGSAQLVLSDPSSNYSSIYLSESATVDWVGFTELVDDLNGGWGFGSRGVLLSDRGLAFSSDGNTAVLHLPPAGNTVGIGSSTPYTTLAVAGEIVMDSFFATTSATSTIAGQLDVTGNLAFSGEIQPDGLSCADGEILKKTADDNWDCAADATGAGGGAGSGAFFELMSNIDYGAPTTTVAIVVGTTTVPTGANSLTVTATSTDTVNFLQLIDSTDTSQFIIDISGLITMGSGGTWDAGGLDIPAGDTYAIDGTDVLTNTTLGSTVVNSSLDSVDALNSGSITSGFGNIDIGSSNFDADGAITSTGTIDFGAATSIEITNNGTVNANGEITTDDTSGQLRYFAGSAERVIEPAVYASFSISTTTAWTASTTRALGPAFNAQTWDAVKCFTDAGTLNVSFSDGTNEMDLLNASTTVGLFTFATNNTFTASEKRFVEIGTPASSPTEISCTVEKLPTAN